MHANNEWVDTNDLVAATKILALTIMEWGRVGEHDAFLSIWNKNQEVAYGNIEHRSDKSLSASRAVRASRYIECYDAPCVAVPPESTSQIHAKIKMGIFAANQVVKRCTFPGVCGSSARSKIVRQELLHHRTLGRPHPSPSTLWLFMKREAGSKQPSAIDGSESRDRGSWPCGLPAASELAKKATG
jgi:hypothetical protein